MSKVVEILLCNSVFSKNSVIFKFFTPLSSNILTSHTSGCKSCQMCSHCVLDVQSTGDFA